MFQQEPRYTLGMRNRSEYQRAWRAKNAAKVLEGKRRWNDDNRGRLNARSRERYAERKAAHWRRGKPEATRPTPARCECCGVPFAEMTKGARLDHDHKTNTFRGWLCQRCNTALGMLGDTLGGVLRLVRYVEGNTP